jgi:hypothetical protein
MTKPIAKRSMSDAAVKAKTGKAWDEWFALLDADGANKMQHKDIALHLRTKYGVGDWWCQMVTVEYERARGMRDMHEKADGYNANASRMLDAPVDKLYRAFADARMRKKWLPDAPLTISTKTENKSLRIRWTDEKGAVSHVDVNLYAKGVSKSQVAIQHSKLARANDATKMKAYWGTALDQLKEILSE